MSYRVLVRNLTNPSQNLAVQTRAGLGGFGVIPKGALEYVLTFATENEYRECKTLHSLLHRGLVSVVTPPQENRPTKTTPLKENKVISRKLSL